MSRLSADPAFKPLQTTMGGQHRIAFTEMLLSSVLGLVASLILSVEALALAADPDATFSCDISATISCGAVGRSWQADLLGFPNAFLGLICEPIIITIAVAALGKVSFPRWFMLGAQASYTVGFLFAYWLFYQSFFNIRFLCPWCLLITVTTTLVFVSMTRINILEGNFGTRVKQRLEPALRYNMDTVVTVLLLAVVASMVVYQYV